MLLLMLQLNQLIRDSKVARFGLNAILKTEWDQQRANSKDFVEPDNVHGLIKSVKACGLTSPRFG
jgi:hypothetical protein